MAIVMMALPSLQVAAESTHDEPQKDGKYISEVKIGVGKDEKEAEDALKGFTILKDGNNNVDLNQNAGGGIGSKGERVVYLGYKTTDEKADAVTDLAVMNMKGGYSVKDYEMLMEQQMTQQIIPFVNNLLKGIIEYRENYSSGTEESKKRAQYVHDALNKLTDDDCKGAGLGDLFLNETKYEMGDEAYDALPDDEKIKHADILTIVAQANGQSIITMVNLLTRACDTNEDTWIDRFIDTSYDDILDIYGDMLPSDAEQELAKEYDDDANEILNMWDALKEELDNYESNVQRLDELLRKDMSQQEAIVENYDESTATEEETAAYIEALEELNEYIDECTSLYADIAVRDYLATIDYNDGTLLDFFIQDTDTISDDITMLYPLVASLTDGQRAGLQYITLADLIMISATDSEGYKSADIDDLVSSSIYDGVNREIYEKGGVALTSDALRSHSAEEAATTGKLSILSYIMYGITAASIVSFGITIGVKVQMAKNYSARVQSMQNSAVSDLDNAYADLFNNVNTNNAVAMRRKAIGTATQLNDPKGIDARYAARSSFCTKLMIGIGVAALILAGVSIYLTYRDLTEYYNVELSPIPHYIVDEKDITGYNEKGEKIVIINQAAYYKAVDCNRAKNDEWYDTMGTCADLNGTVGRQWLALYAEKNSDNAPILASSVIAVIGKDDVPPDYTTGIHMFGSSAAFNINNTQYIWNNDAKSVFVYFNVDQSEKSALAATGSVTSGGYLALIGIGGLLVGILGTVCVTLAMKKKKKSAKTSEE